MMTMGEKRLDHLLAELLKEHGGVFLGEQHDSPSLRQAVRQMLPMLKANGVGTLSFEAPQSLIDEMLAAKSAQEFLAKWPGADSKVFATVYGLVHEANRLGIKVLGHDRPDELLAIARLDPNSMDKPTKLKRDEIYNNSINEHGMKERDSYAANHIQAHRSGKVVVIGGAWHSGNYTREDLPTTKFYEDIKTLRSKWWFPPEEMTIQIMSFEHWYTTGGRTAKGGVEVKDQYQGLDARLGYPSVDYNPLGGPVGITRPTDGKFNNYEVFLPQDFGQLNVTSLPAKPPSPRREKAQRMSQR
jgi:hypothetical protein